MGPWSFWTSRANSEPLPIKPRYDSPAKSPLGEESETSWSTDDKVYATSAPGGWDQQLEPLPASHPFDIQPDDSAYQAFGRPLVLNRMDSPLQEADDSVSSIIRGVHEDEIRELVAAIKQLREQAAKDAELIAELRGQAEDNSHAIGVVRIENERLMKELSATASAARVAAAAVAAAAASATDIAGAAPNSPPTHSPPSPPKTDEGKEVPKQAPPVSTLSNVTSSPFTADLQPTPPTHSPPSPPKTDEGKEVPKQALPVSTPSSSKPTRATSPPKTDEGKEIPKQAPPGSTPSSSKTTRATSPSFTANLQPPPSPNVTIFETYDRMVNLLKNKPRPDVQLGDYPWPMFPEPPGSFPQRITLRSDVKWEKVDAFVQAYTSAYGPGRRKERGEAMVKAWKSIMDRSEDTILKGTAARAFTYMDRATRSL